jgi:Cu/Ag efflux pump CusA
VQTITLNVAGGGAGTFEQKARLDIATHVKLAPGDYVEFSGTAEAEAQSGVICWRVPRLPGSD